MAVCAGVPPPARPASGGISPTKAFSVPSTGRVKVITALSSKARKYLRRHRTLKTRVTVVLGHRAFRATTIVRSS